MVYFNNSIFEQKLFLNRLCIIFIFSVLFKIIIYFSLLDYILKKHRLNNSKKYIVKYKIFKNIV